MSAYICDAVRTPIGRYAGGLSSVRPDDLAAIPIRALLARNPELGGHCIDDVTLGCANQAGEDNRNVARMSALLAGLPEAVPGNTVNRLCGSGLDAVSIISRAIRCGEIHVGIAGGVESMSRAPFVVPKSVAAFSRIAEIYDTTIGWRFVNAEMELKYGVDSMPETAENVAERFAISRDAQDQFALRSQQRVANAQRSQLFSDEIVAVTIKQRKGDDAIVAADEHPRANTTLEALRKLNTPFREDGTVAAGNASGVNDGACALLIASDHAVSEYCLTPLARVVGTAVAGVDPSIMGYGPVPAIQRLLEQTGVSLQDIEVIELNEAFAAQALACTRALGFADDAPFVNPNGGAISLGHPLGMSGARLVTTAAYQLRRTGGRYALCAMCIGVGQGIAMLIDSQV